MSDKTINKPRSASSVSDKLFEMTKLSELLTSDTISLLKQVFESELCLWESEIRLSQVIEVNEVYLATINGLGG